MIRVLGDRVLVLLPPQEPETTTDSGLVLIKDPELRTSTRGIVAQLGEKTHAVDLDAVCDRITDVCQEARKVAEVIAAVRTLAPAAFEVAVGDCVIFPPSAGDLIEHEGHRYVILHESEIHGILQPVTKAEAA